MAEAIEATYFDTADVYRMDKVKQPNGAYKQQRSKIYSAIPCGFSMGTRPTYSTIAEALGKENDVTNNIRAKYKVYANPSYIINQGDQLIVTSNGRTLTVVAGLTMVYDTHQLIEVEWDGEA